MTQIEDPNSGMGTEDAEYLLAKLAQIEPGIKGESKATPV